MIKPWRWSFLLAVAPSWFVSRRQMWAHVDLEKWSADVYTWEQDDWGGLRDTMQHPVSTFKAGTGDCDDYALVAASWLVMNTTDEVNVALLFGDGGHVVVYTETHVYSSGRIHEESFETWYEQSDYTRKLTRRVRARKLV